MFILYKGLSFIPFSDELYVFKDGTMIGRYPIPEKHRTTEDIVEVIYEVMEM